MRFPRARAFAARGQSLGYFAMSMARMAGSGAIDAAALLRAPRLPRWVDELLPRSCECDAFAAASCGVRITATTRVLGEHALLSLRAERADVLTPLAFQKLSWSMYNLARRVVADFGASFHPVRIWNFLPQIRTKCGDDLDRYMVFNAGRFAALYDWYACGAAFSTSMAAATGVGHEGDDLEVHLLASASEGTPVENPLQIPAYRYSSAYGPLPPCFARATRCGGSGGLPPLLVGGTASVRGELSLHEGDVLAQTEETLANLRALVAAAQLGRGGADPLSRFDSVRVYLARDELLEIVRPRVESAFASVGAHSIEWFRADICRPELLVEIEGTCA